MSVSTWFRVTLVAFVATTFSACSQQPPLQVVDHVDLQRFMGDWYVIANIPTAIDKGAYNAIETYRIDDDGTIATTFTFRDKGFDGEIKTYNPRGFIQDDSNAIWGMQFVWPIKADFRIISLDEDYTVTVVGRNKRDYVWIMARRPEISEQAYVGILNMLKSVGYETDQIKKVPQQW